jgi:hypothetical protein
MILLTGFPVTRSLALSLKRIVPIGSSSFTSNVKRQGRVSWRPQSRELRAIGLVSLDAEGSLGGGGLVLVTHGRVLVFDLDGNDDEGGRGVAEQLLSKHMPIQRVDSKGR